MCTIKKHFYKFYFSLHWKLMAFHNSMLRCREPYKLEDVDLHCTSTSCLPHPPIVIREVRCRRHRNSASGLRCVFQQHATIVVPELNKCNILTETTRCRRAHECRVSCIQFTKASVAGVSRPILRFNARVSSEQIPMLILVVSRRNVALIS
jgi:hypothetical protein